MSNLLIRMEGAQTPAGSPPAPRKAKQPGMDINSPHLQAK
ncbi:hypothetical protein SD77_0029 [Bacillus badius]|uniref:Ribose 5-phosphate isomerase B n=1 Tax=Bacillus badius TaxID=1455 RepID=A0ABR5AZL7_BACBA|nr:hypothetical protein SD78_3353 [Bacillus badius]KIL80181.1 hypothetical protein SD77_0029 [Bacillus badius]